MLRIAGLDRSNPIIWAALLYAAFFAVGWLVGLLVEFTMGRALNELSLDILMALR